MSDFCPICNSELEPSVSVCPACGFKLSGSTESFQPIKLDEPAIATVSVRPQKKASLRVVRGPQIETVFPLAYGKLAIGRIPTCAIFLNDMTVSRNHAYICGDEQGFSIADDNSFNGVWVNNQNVVDAILHDGDIIQIGCFLLRYEESLES